MLRKGVPLIVGNLGPATFGRDDNALVLVDAQDDRALPPDGCPRPTSSPWRRALMQDIAQRLQAETP
jgi:phosphopantothenoylcysteine decarboxylase/phosphopantothenate--cysteine ligase